MQDNKPTRKDITQAEHKKIELMSSGTVGTIFVIPFLLLLFARTFSFDPPSETETGGSIMKTLVLTSSYSCALGLLLWRGGGISSLFSKIAPLFLMAAYALITAIWSIDPVTVLFRVMHMMGVGVVALATGFWIRGRTEMFIRIMLFSMVAAVALSLYFVYYVPMRGLFSPEYGRDVSRWTGITPHPNGLGMIAIVAVWAVLSCLFFKGRLFLKIAVVATLPVTLFVVHGSGSRTSMTSIAFLAVVFFLIRGVKPLNASVIVKRLGIGLSTLLMGGLLLYVAAPDKTAKLLFPEVREGSTDSLSGRPEIWGRGIDALAENPFGWCYDNLGTYWSEHSGDRSFLHFHNGYLDIAVRGGFVGELLLLTILFRMYKSTIKLRTCEPLFAKCFSLFFWCNIIYSFTESGFDRETLLWPILVVLWCGAESLLIMHKRSSQPICYINPRSNA